MEALVWLFAGAAVFVAAIKLVAWLDHKDFVADRMWEENDTLRNNLLKQWSQPQLMEKNPCTCAKTKCAASCSRSLTSTTPGAGSK